MRRTGRVFLILCILVGCMVGLWVFQSWRTENGTQEETELHNVYVTAVQGNKLQGVSEGENKEWVLRSELKTASVTGVADLVLSNDRVIRIRRKPDVIQGKLLGVSEKSLELEGYGEVALATDFRLYHRTEEQSVTQGDTAELTVGSTDVTYVVASGKICAALVEETTVAETTASIRVVLSDSRFSSYEFDRITISATEGCTVKSGEKTSRLRAGKKKTWRAGKKKETVVLNTGGEGRLRIENLKRQYGVPAYRGTLEIHFTDKSLYVINELPLEEYLYSVVPSEMPTEYSTEALKAQAVCARSYAVAQMQGNRMAKWGAHVDDSVSFQVYNNLKEDERSIAAVKATKNQVLSYQGELANTYFYSVSCGSSAGIREVWFAKKDKAYLPTSKLGEERTEVDLSKEKNFKNFLKKTDVGYDAGAAWYRWHAAISLKNLQKSIQKGIKKRYQVNSSQIQTRQEDGSFKSTGELALGTLKKIKILQRGESGVAMAAELEGSKNTIRVYTEYNIRQLLIGENTVFYRQDKKQVTGLACLPSGFFYLEKKKGEYVFYGGGYGHGVGLSQNGANELAKNGKSCGEILTYYFPGTSVEDREALAGNV